MPELVYKKAGNLELYRHRDGKEFLFNGVVNSLGATIGRTTANLNDGNSDWDYVFTTGRSGQVTVNLNSFQPRLYAALVAADFTDDTSANIRRINEYAIPAASPYTVSLAKTPVNGTIVVVNQDDSPFTVGSGAGQYTVNGSDLTFNSADAGKPVVVAYDYNAASASKMQLAAEAGSDIFKVTIAGEAVDKNNESVVKADAIVFDRMMPTGEIPWPSRQKEPQGWQFTLAVLKPRPGYKVVDYIVER